jgi:hypothetical protein
MREILKNMRNILTNRWEISTIIKRWYDEAVLNHFTINTYESTLKVLFFSVQQQTAIEGHGCTTHPRRLVT